MPWCLARGSEALAVLMRRSRPAMLPMSRMNSYCPRLSPQLQPSTMKDAIIFFNFRSDRAREITRALTFKDFDGFSRQRVPQLAGYVCMTEYDATFGLPIAYAQQELTNLLGGVLAEAGMKQLRIAETEKYAHVTFFFNGGVEAPFSNEDRALIPSQKRWQPMTKNRR